MKHLLNIQINNDQIAELFDDYVTQSKGSIEFYQDSDPDAFQMRKRKKGNKTVLVDLAKESIVPFIAGLFSLGVAIIAKDKPLPPPPPPPPTSIEHVTIVTDKGEIRIDKINFDNKEIIQGLPDLHYVTKIIINDR